MVENLALQRVLVWLGLSELQAKVYLTLLEGGAASAEVICKRIGTSRSVVDYVLRELKELGLVKESLLLVTVSELRRNSFG
jgi:predicted transcriptional regulator